MDYRTIIYRYYPEDDELRRLLLKHSRQVADRALAIAERHPEWNLDREFLEAAAMLHDIGIFRCDAPGIHCHGTEPYIRHGQIGAELIRQADQAGVGKVFNDESIGQSAEQKAKQEHREPTQLELIEENRRLRSQNANLQDQIKQLKSQILSLQRTIARIS